MSKERLYELLQCFSMHLMLWIWSSNCLLNVPKSRRNEWEYRDYSWSFWWFSIQKFPPTCHKILCRAGNALVHLCELIKSDYSLFARSIVKFNLNKTLNKSFSALAASIANEHNHWKKCFSFFVRKVEFLRSYVCIEYPFAPLKW